MARIDTDVAANFLARCFAPGDTVALLIRRDNPLFLLQRIVSLENALAPRYLGWFAHENATGANVYVAANPLRVGSRQRTKESVAAVRHLYIDIDTDGDARLAALRASDAVPTPTAILSTSQGKYQVLWRGDGFDFERQETALKLLASAFGNDPACTDCNRVLRVPGFLNCKYDPAQLVTVEYLSDSVSNPGDFRMKIPATKAGLPAPVNGSRKHPGKHSYSEDDWAGVLRELESGKDAAKLTRELASRRSDKPDPLYYARRTVDMASAKLWLLESVPFSDVVTMLEFRHRFGFPPVAGRTRAQEIAWTAERMICHTNSTPKESQDAVA
jgi:hypothetical protein